MNDIPTIEERRARARAAEQRARVASVHRDDFVGLDEAEGEALAAELGVTLRWLDVSGSDDFYVTDDQVAGRVTVYARDGVATRAAVDS